jgi:hypothetical protein
MASSPVPGSKNGWASLLTRYGGQESVYEEALRITCAAAAGDLAGSIELHLAGFSDALAAVTVLGGSAKTRPYVDQVSRLVARLNRRLERSSTNINVRSTVDLLVVVAESEAIGSMLPAPKFEVEDKFTDFVVSKQLSKHDKLAVALLALDLDRLDDVRGLFGKVVPARPDTPPSADPVDLVKTLTVALKSESGKTAVAPAWDAFLRAFPALLAADAAEWQHILLAGRIVLHKLEGLPVDQVADAIHRRVVALAAEPSA